eukprot:8102471-Pyramimonas_sp.AAC.1
MRGGLLVGRCREGLLGWGGRRGGTLGRVGGVSAFRQQKGFMYSLLGCELLSTACYRVCGWSRSGLVRREYGSTVVEYLVHRTDASSPPRNNEGGSCYLVHDPEIGLAGPRQVWSSTLTGLAHTIPYHHSRCCVSSHLCFKSSHIPITLSVPTVRVAVPTLPKSASHTAGCWRYP